MMALSRGDSLSPVFSSKYSEMERRFDDSGAEGADVEEEGEDELKVVARAEGLG